MNIEPKKYNFSSVIVHNGRESKIFSSEVSSLESEFKWIKGISNLKEIQDSVPNNPKYDNKTLSFDEVKGDSLGNLYCASFNENDSKKIIKKAFALFNRAQTVCIRNIKNEPIPKFNNIYLKLFKENLLNNPLGGKYKTWKVNGEEYLDIFNIEVFGNMMEMAENACKRPKIRIMHGNYLMSNIILDENGIKVIDPRGEFGNGTSILGDARFDLAKLRMSIEGYESIVRNKYLFSYNGNNLNYKIIIPTDIKSNLEFYDSLLYKNDYDVDMIKEIEGGIILCLMNLTKDDELRHLLYAKALELLSIKI